ncbi:hypothetical protein CVT25_015335 [Psilocybe cyanescens]|uniref:Uncharacterized protein n=1 Tax=Psilocybe cyanescens TaxID=93625 RepID=A0A409WH81_PSICY|nr:hypothetical protein CVT25_015335 [Psilocybe cyanescens]
MLDMYFYYGLCDHIVPPLAHVPSIAPNWSYSWTGKQTCKDRVPRGARIAIAITCLLVLVLLATLVICVIRNRRSSVVSEREYNVEASQVDGPPTIIATEYNPTSGPSGVYSGRKSPYTGNADSRMSPQPQMSGPMYPETARHYSNNNQHSINQNHTAPHSQVTFPDAYPFTGYSNSMGPPKTAFVSGGFPRPLLAGDRLKDRIKERPASISSLTTTVPVPAYRA